MKRAKQTIGKILDRARRGDSSAMAWMFYDWLARLSGVGRLTSYAAGRLNDDLTEHWRVACRPEIAIPYSVDQDCPGYIVNRSKDAETRVQAHFSWFDVTALDRDLIAETISALREPVTAALGGPWRVVNFKVARSIAHAPDVEMFAWHTDGFPENFLKILVYISGATEESGGTELKLADGTVTLCGPPGTWALFNNNNILHRGRPVTTGERVLIEVTITRAFRHGIAYGTVNSSYPRFPWHQSSLPRRSV